MLFKVSTNTNYGTVNLRLSRVWIKTGNPKMPLKSVWFNEAKLHSSNAEFCAAECESENRELTDDHLVLAA